MSIRRYLKPIDGLLDPKGSLSNTVPSAATASANRDDRHLAKFGGHIYTLYSSTTYRCGNLSHSKLSPFFHADGTTTQCAYYLWRVYNYKERKTILK